MKKARESEGDDDVSPEYDFSTGVRGKHAMRYAGGTNVVRLDSDVAKCFPTAESVNSALRSLISIATRTVKS